jgi:hypothetical protein
MTHIHNTYTHNTTQHNKTQVHGLLLSMKDTGIPDEAFFATAALWLINTAEVTLYSAFLSPCVCLELFGVLLAAAPLPTLYD